MASEAQIARAAAVLARGGVVAFPTETVYGLGADAASASAVARIYALKGRPADHPVIVHTATTDAARGWARAFTPAAERLAAAFWPGPLTLILPRAPQVLDAVTGGQETVALRVPSHPVAQALLSAFGGGVAAPSANRFGRVSATTAEHVREEFGDAVEIVLDGGEADVGIESTIVDVSGARARLLRPGAVSVADLEAVLADGITTGPDARSPRAPGTLKAHYAPFTPLMLVEADLAPELVRSLVRQEKTVAVLSFSALRPLLPGLTWAAAPADPAGYAHALYANLRELDHARADVIVVEAPPQRPEWHAVRDRLERAAAGSADRDAI